MLQNIYVGFVYNAVKGCGLMIEEKKAVEIVEENYNSVFQYCLALLKDCNEAEDVTQEVFMFFWQHLNELEDQYIATWLIAVAKNKIHEQFRVRTRHHKIFDDVDIQKVADEKSDDFDILEEIGRVSEEEIQNIKERIISGLTPEEREIFIYIYEKKMKYKAVAEVLDINVNTLGTNLRRMRIKVNEIVKTSFMLAIYVFIKLKMY